MSEISTNYRVALQAQSNAYGVDDYWRKVQRKNTGITERVYNGVKNVTGLGTGTKKVERAVEQAKQGQISQEQLRDTFHKYESSQETSAQLLGDMASVGAAGGTFFWLFRHGKMLSAKFHLNNGEEFVKLITAPSGLKNTISSLCKNNKKMIAYITGISALAGGLTKWATMKVNRIGSKEYKVDENAYGPKTQRDARTKAIINGEKKQLKKEKRSSSFKNFLSGTINGLMMPVMLLGGAIGAPIYLVGNSLNRYFVGTKTDKNKSVGGYIDNLSGDIVTTGLATAAMAVPLVKKGNWTKVFNENITKVTEKLAKANLKAPDYKTRSALSDLEEVLLNSGNVKDIINNRSISVEEQIKRLTDENIFAVKFKQISADSTTLTNALREKCPATRTLEQAQSYVDKQLGKGYKISKCLGVGTIAETYLAKTPDGKEVCLKVVKEGISEKKILADKQKFIDLIKALPDKSKEEKDYLLKNIEDLADGILKEVDFKNEMEAAQKLVPFTKVANVVKPIDVKNGIYIMEKAEGISLSSLVDLNEAKLYKECLQKDSLAQEVFRPQEGSKLFFELEGKKTKEEQIKAIDAYIKRIEERTPQFGNIDLTKEDANYLTKEYMKVLVEQFNKVEKGGKVLHADIHPGNIFIDINALKAKKGKIFTLIDTGNVVNQTAEQAMRSINLSSYIKRGNVPDLVDYVLEGATLPKGMTNAEAKEKLSQELKKLFFDSETQLDKVTNETILTTSSNIMRKFGIIPSDTQLNFNKARQSADNSLFNMIEVLSKFYLKDFDGSASSLAKIIGGGVKEGYTLKNHYKSLMAAQERLNLKELPLAEQIKHLKNPNMLPTNSEDYLTYKLKQSMFRIPKVD